MNKQDKYRAASLANFTPEELKKASENLAFASRRFPEEHAVEQQIIRDKGLADHRGVIEHYTKYKMPMTGHELSALQLYQDSNYFGGFGKGEQFEPAQGASAADLLFRAPIKPDGA